MKRLLYLIFAVFCVFPLSVRAQETEYRVVETRISQEEFAKAFDARAEYNLVRDTMLTDDVKAAIVDRVVASFDDETRGLYECGDYHLRNICRLPTGCYMVDAVGYSWCYAYLLDEKMNLFESTIEASDASAYSVDGIYVGCEGFDCDPCAKLHFYSISPSGNKRITEMASYVNYDWVIPYDYYPHHVELVDCRYISTPLVWWQGALYCVGVTRPSTTEEKPSACFYRLELRANE